jgi:hypothetical protein
MSAPAIAVTPAPSYLSVGATLRSWLLTTDHKRIALLYLGSITFFFWLFRISRGDPGLCHYIWRFPAWPDASM